MSAESRALLPLTCVLLAACVTHRAPRGFLPDTREAQTQAGGGWIEVSYRAAQGGGQVVGELLAATADSVWVMTTVRPTVIATADVVSGRLVGYDARPRTVAVATLVGALATASNGAFLVFTAPMWIIGGSLATSSQSKVALEELPTVRWTDLAPFARFPQGIPPSLDLEELRPLRR
jgi:hypothetical protein